jgi:hypothetical protein
VVAITVTLGRSRINATGLVRSQDEEPGSVASHDSAPTGSDDEEAELDVVVLLGGVPLGMLFTPIMLTDVNCTMIRRVCAVAWLFELSVTVTCNVALPPVAPCSVTVQVAWPTQVGPC